MCLFIQVGPLSKSTLAHCHCTPGSIFSASLLVAPNALDFKNDWALFLKIGDNLVPIITLGFLFALWALLMLYGARQDRQDQDKVRNL